MKTSYPIKKAALYIGDYALMRKYDTEVRLCPCPSQSCKGRYLTKTTSLMRVCPGEAKRIGIIRSMEEYYG